MFVLNVVVMLIFEGVIELDDGGDQKNAHGHDTGDASGFGTFGVGQFCVFLDHSGGGLVNAGAGKQGEQGNNQISNGRIFPDAGHNFRINGGHNGSPEIGT